MKNLLSSVILVLAAVAAGCGGGSPEPVSGAVEMSFGVPAFAPASGVSEFPVRVFNYSSAGILDMGVRPVGTTEWMGGLSGHDPFTFGAPHQGGTPWVVLDHGTYEVFVETTQGRIQAIGHTAVVEILGRFYPAPTDVYLFGGDLTPAPVP